MSVRLLVVSENPGDVAERALGDAVRAALELRGGGTEVNVTMETLGAASRAALKAGGWNAKLTDRRGVCARRELRDHLLQEGLAAVIFQVEGDEEDFTRCVVEPIRRDLGALRGVADRLVRWSPDAGSGGAFVGAAERLCAVPGLAEAMGWSPA